MIYTAGINAGREGPLTDIYYQIITSLLFFTEYWSAGGNNKEKIYILY